MKRTKLTSAIAFLSLVLFMSVASYANSGESNSGDLPKSGDKNLSASGNAETEYNYLRFDVNKYVILNDDLTLNNTAFDFLRFDVNDFMSADNTDALELPVANEFEYLSFNVNNYTESDSDNLIVMPVPVLDYLRFNVQKITIPAANVEFPVAE